MFNFKDIEIYNIQEQDRFGLTRGFLAVVDFRRPSTLDDFPWLKSVETPETFSSSSNLIKALFLTDNNPDAETTDELAELAESCMTNLFSRDWDLSLEVVIDKDIGSTTLEPLVVLNKFTEILNNNYGIKLELPAVAPDAFNHLSSY
jgi:hypothetical protein